MSVSVQNACLLARPDNVLLKTLADGGGEFETCRKTTNSGCMVWVCGASPQPPRPRPCAAGTRALSAYF
jgi:hypothetical protein